MSNKNFQAKRFQLVSITRTLDNYLCCAFLFRFMTYFQSYNETLYKAISTNLENFGYFLSFVWREDEVNRYLQIDSFSLHIVSQSSVTFLSLLTWLIVHNLFFDRESETTKSSKFGFFRHVYNTIYNIMSSDRKGRTTDFVPTTLDD